MAPRKDAATLQIAKLKRQRGTARRLYDKASRAVEAALEQEVRQLTVELAEERGQRESLAAQLEEANGNLKVARQKRKGLRAELDAERTESDLAQGLLTEANEKLKTATALCESLRAELAKQLDNCVKMTFERDAERIKSAHFVNQLKQLRDKALPHAVFNGCSCLFAPAHNFDFRKVEDAGKTFVRGGTPYIRPTGSMRYALEVANRYDDKDWLKNDASGWAVAYHGTARENALSIVRNGFHVSKGTRFGYGTGVYCTPDPNTAQTYYSSDFVNN
ncbi:hypothetical protein AAVH_26153, partial [Aphelenchoides avenae]